MNDKLGQLDLLLFSDHSRERTGFIHNINDDSASAFYTCAFPTVRCPNVFQGKGIVLQAYICTVL